MQRSAGYKKAERWKLSRNRGNEIMVFSIKKVIIRRTLEFLISNAIISLFLTILNIFGVLETQTQLGFTTLLGVSVFLLLNVKLSRDCYFDLRSNYNYYFSNIVSYLIFVLIGVLVYVMFPDYIFTCFFAIIKVAKYSIFTVSTMVSMLCFHAVGILCVVIAPIGMGWVFDMIDNRMGK